MLAASADNPAFHPRVIHLEYEDRTRPYGHRLDDPVLHDLGRAAGGDQAGEYRDFAGVAGRLALDRGNGDRPRLDIRAPGERVPA
ncbi:protein of unknown function [Thauera humireducens]|nr:protein of unknown function [Thauera humireducens]